MKKAIAILVLWFLFCNASFAEIATGYKYGKGPLKLTRNVADTVEYYFSGGKKGRYAKKQKTSWKPAFIMITHDGTGYYFYRHPAHVSKIDNRHYVGTASKACRKKYGKECFVFANAYKIVWDNGSDKKRRRLKIKEIMNGQTLQILKELGFYGGSIAKTTTPSIDDENKKKAAKAAEKKRKEEEKKAERKRLKAEKKRLEEEKKAERKRLEEEKKAEKKRLKAEKKRLEEEKKAEKKRLEEEKKAAKAAKEKAKDTGTSLATQIKELDKLYKKGLLTEEEFKEAKKQIINN